jgi:hypothetical protein
MPNDSGCIDRIAAAQSSPELHLTLPRLREVAVGAMNATGRPAGISNNRHLNRLSQPDTQTVFNPAGISTQYPNR